MNSLVAVRTGSAYFYSRVATYTPGLLPPPSVVVYYEAAAVIVALVLFGRWLEAVAGLDRRCIRCLLIGLQLETATFLREGHAGRC